MHAAYMRLFEYNMAPIGSKILDHSLFAVEGFLHRHRDVDQRYLKQDKAGMNEVVKQYWERWLNHSCIHILKTASNRCLAVDVSQGIPLNV